MAGSPPPRAVLLVRHGETEWSASRRHTGRTDLALTEAGEIEALHAGTVLDQLLGISDPTVVYSSPRRRALHTAELVRGRELAAPQITELLAEFDYGDYEGLTGDQIRAHRPDWELWRDGCPGGETPQEVFARAAAFVEMAGREAAGGIVVAFTHGHMSRALTAEFLDLGPPLAMVLHNDTASIAEMRSRDGLLTLVGWNVRPHAAVARA